MILYFDNIYNRLLYLESLALLATNALIIVAFEIIAEFIFEKGNHTSYNYTIFWFYSAVFKLASLRVILINLKLITTNKI